MAVSTITRTSWTDDDGSGTTGTIINNAQLQAIYAAIDQMFGGGGAYTTFTFGGAIASAGQLGAYVAKTANYTVTASDYTINCTANTFTVTLLTAVGRTGQIFVIKNSGAGVITVATTSSQTIDGGSTYSLAVQYQSVTVQSDGANWIIL